MTRRTYLPSSPDAARSASEALLVYFGGPINPDSVPDLTVEIGVEDVKRPGGPMVFRAFRSPTGGSTGGREKTRTRQTPLVSDAISNALAGARWSPCTLDGWPAQWRFAPYPVGLMFVEVIQVGHNAASTRRMIGAYNGIWWWVGDGVFAPKGGAA